MSQGEHDHGNGEVDDVSAPSIGSMRNSTCR